MYTTEEILDRIYFDGFEYALLDYLTPDKISDPKLRELVLLFRATKDGIKEHLRKLALTENIHIEDFEV